MKKVNTEWVIDVIKYSVIWMFFLGVTTVFIAPFYQYLLDTIGVWIYLVFILLGILTKKWLSISSK